MHRGLLDVPGLEQHGGKPGVRCDRARVEDAVEKFSVIKTLQAIDECHVVIGVLDAREGVAEQDATLLGQAVERGRALVIAINKWDGLSQGQRDEARRLLDIKLRPERHNKVKVLMLMDVGGSMDDHIKRVEELFSATKTEFKHLEYYYFHNCLYDYVWKNNRRRHAEKLATWDLLHKYTSDYKIIFVGDATMSPYEILQPGGSVEYNNAEAGAVWLNRMTEQFPHFVWLNPEPEGLWQYRQSITVINQLMKGRMYPVTLAGLEQAMKVLSK